MLLKNTLRLIVITKEINGMITDYDLNDIVEMKKKHPRHEVKNTGKLSAWAPSIKIKCLGCGAAIMFRSEFERKCKKLIEKADKTE